MKNEAAERDLETYCKSMAQPNGWETCLRIERRYGLDGYPPEVVTTYLAAEVAEEGTGEAAVDKMLGPREEDDDAEFDESQLGF